jgi:hypothetical protein
MKLTRTVFQAVTVAVAIASASAGTLAPIVDASGADPFSTNPLGINDFGVVGGGYTTGGGAIERFRRTPDRSLCNFRLFDQRIPHRVY